ncbi:MAG: thioredoxin [Actinomycetota bacterium]
MGEGASERLQLSSAPRLDDGWHVVVKRDCPTCVEIAPALRQLVGEVGLTIWSQDDPGFPEDAPVSHDADLAVSWHHEIDTAPTLLHIEAGAESSRLVGWKRDDWEKAIGRSPIGPGLTDWMPGCGSKSVEPGMVDELAFRFGLSPYRSRRVEFASAEDEVEAMYERGWSDGLPVVAPTEERVARMLAGTVRDAQDVVAVVPPNLVEATVERVAINAVMAGCRPEYLPVVLAAVEAACTDRFNMHGLLCTLWFSGPIIIVNGPIRHEIGMNMGRNALGQGNRANSTIGRALQLVIRNVGGGHPGEVGIDRAALGSPSKVGWCFPEDEESLPPGWPSLAVERGFEPEDSTVTLFAGHGPSGIVDQTSRTPDELLDSMVGRLLATGNLRQPSEAMLVLTPEHQRVFADAGWTKADFRDALESRLVLDPAIAQAGISGGETPAGGVPKFRRGSMLIVRTGGDAGAFSAIIEGWIGGSTGSEPITHAITG